MAGMKVTAKQLTLTRDYLVNYSEKYEDVIPSMVGLALALDVPRHNLTNLKRDPPKPTAKTAAATRQRDMLRLLDKCQDMQHQRLINGSLTGELNSNIAKLALGKHGYSDKQDNTLAGPDGGAIPVDTKWTVEFIGVEK
jgi:hypothetical protein